MKSFPDYVTIDGYDFVTGKIIKKISIWRDYENRDAGVVAMLKHGKKVKWIEKKGTRATVKLGLRYKFRIGYVSYFFIKELKKGLNNNG